MYPFVCTCQASQGGKGQPQQRAQQEQEQQQGGRPAQQQQQQQQQQQGEQEEPACASGVMPGAAVASQGAAARPDLATRSTAEGGTPQGAAAQSGLATGGGGAAVGYLPSGEAAGAGSSKGESTAAAAAAAPGAGAAAAAAAAATEAAAAASEAGAASVTPTADAGAGAAAAAAASGAVAAPVRALGPVAIRLSLEETFFLKYTLRCLTAIRAPGSTGGAATGVVPSELTEQVGLLGQCGDGIVGWGAGLHRGGVLLLVQGGGRQGAEKSPDTKGPSGRGKTGQCCQRR